MSETNLTMEGGCLCGAVRFTSKGPSLFSAHCHCHWCRRAHGAAFVTWLGVREEGFSVTSGSDNLRWYASSEASRRGFCATCGTTMLFTSTLAPGEVHVAQACLDGPADKAPQAHVFYDAHVSWVEVGDTLPRLESGQGGLAKYNSVPAEPPSAVAARALGR